MSESSVLKRVKAVGSSLTNEFIPATNGAYLLIGSGRELQATRQRIEKFSALASRLASCPRVARVIHPEFPLSKSRWPRTRRTLPLRPFSPYHYGELVSSILLKFS